MRQSGEELGQLICDDEQSQCQTADRTGGNIGAAGLNAALKQQAVLTELSDNMDSFEDELFRIEEYVSMALQYQRVSSTENDFVLEKVSVDGVIRDTIKKICKNYDTKAYWDKLFRNRAEGIY